MLKNKKNRLSYLENVLLNNNNNSSLKFVSESEKTTFFADEGNNKKYNIFEGIPDFFGENDSKITDTQKDFYNNIKFPNYDDIDDLGSLIDKSIKNIFSNKLDKEISYDAKILEVGCGTGQLTNFLARYSRELYGIDLSKGSLLLAENFRKKNQISRAFFIRMDVFNLFFMKNNFDVIISNGVLHHTKDAKLAFKNLIKYLKPNGYVVVGLYHKYGRSYTRLIQFLVKYFGDNFKFMDKKNIDPKISKDKRYAWFNDQYKNPHETLHTYSEVIDWFTESNIEFLSSIPFGIESNIHETKIFSKVEIKKGFGLFLEEFIQMFKFNQIREGGFFIMIGKKKNN